MKETAKETFSETIFSRLADAIVRGVVAPGERLEEPAIARQFGVSRTPVREALRRLCGTGLVEVAPRRGVTVVRIDVAQLTDMFDAIGELEALCARLSAQRMTMLERKKLEQVNERCRELVDTDADGNYAAFNDQFHELIYLGAHNASIAATTRGFRQRLGPFRILQFVRAGGRAQAAFREHDEIVAGILASDGERAHRAMRSHIASSSLDVIEHFAKRAGLPETALGGPVARVGARQSG
jgi:DNA-binding GntR family transcriptional regulator